LVSSIDPDTSHQNRARMIRPVGIGSIFSPPQVFRVWLFKRLMIAALDLADY
jgi:hypothetical protein